VPKEGIEMTKRKRDLKKLVPILGHLEYEQFEDYIAHYNVGSS